MNNDSGRDEAAATWSAAASTGFELGTDGPSAILVGVDGSPTSLRAAAYAAGMARRQHSRLIAVYAKQSSTVPGIDAWSGIAAAAISATQDEVETSLRDAVEQRAGAWGVDVVLLIRNGEPFHALTEAATEFHADAIVVGSSTSIGHRIAGSLAVRLVRSGRWPVTVVP
jgi:nucleotide-binding universal stress UspA family protein